VGTIHDAAPPSAPEPLKLSVMLKAYNHERYIAQALDNALSQRTSFKYEILVGEDCSTDGTRAVVDRYANRYPERIRVVAHERNVGMVRNTLALYAAARGEYVAWLDGDDYWISADKLERQVAFLDAHPAYTACFHPVVVISPDGPRRMRRPTVAAPVTLTLEQVLAGTDVDTPASTFVFRKVIDVFPPWFETLPYADLALRALHAERGLTVWLPEPMAAYRSGGASARALGFDPAAGVSRVDFWAGKQADVCRALDRHFDYKYHALLRTALANVTGSGIHRFLPRSPRVRYAVERLISRHPAAARLARAGIGAVTGTRSWLAALVHPKRGPP
jgi:glycosyltransferase involved in cell wall biosynthesis